MWGLYSRKNMKRKIKVRLFQVIDKQDITLLILGAVCFLILGFCISELRNIQIEENKQAELKIQEEARNNITYQCSNDSLENTSRCLLQRIQPYYFYNISNKDNKNLTDEQLFEQGSVCWRWADYFTQEFRKYGFWATNVIINETNGTRHEFTISSYKDGNKDAYCINDQLALFCFKQ